jgi:hypothetical protein
MDGNTNGQMSDLVAKQKRIGKINLQKQNKTFLKGNCSNG